MDIPNKKPQAEPEPTKRQPEGESMNKIAMTIGWKIPTWIEKDLWQSEFMEANAQVDMFNTLGTVIETLSAVEEPSEATITFAYWRKPNKQAKKRKPIQLDATLYQHPDYDSFWLYLTYAS